MTRPATFGELRASGWTSRQVKEEIRANAVRKLTAGEPLVDGVVGYEDTVLPQVANALLAGHDMIFLGERGQAKTRIMRSLVNLLDEWLPIVAGSEINDDPFHPISSHARVLLAERGDETPIEWVHRERRFGEKLATPDTSIADLIGEVDPIKVAEGRYLSDELTIHYGLVPRTNRGIFAINELPDLAERIQVGLLNVLEERDVQIRGYKIRLPLDVVLVASANPEDYTNRGRIITPLKDRFGAQIRTHYPLETELEIEIIEQEARAFESEGLNVAVPDFMTEIVAEISQLARRSPHVNQRSGVSARLSIANYETLVANATRRALASGERDVVPRVSDLDALTSSTSGKIEIETLEDGREGQVLERIMKAAVLEVFRARVRPEKLGPIVAFVRRRLGRAHRRGRARRPTTARCSSSSKASGRCSPTSRSASRRPGSRPASSSSSRACTSPSGSTRTPSAPAPPTAPAADAPRFATEVAAVADCRRTPVAREELGAAAGFAVAGEAAELHVEAVVPLVVVDAGPVEEAAQVDAVGDRVLDDLQRLAQHVACAIRRRRCRRRARRSATAGPAARRAVGAGRCRGLRSTARTPSARRARRAGTARACPRGRRRSRSSS